MNDTNIFLSKYNPNTLNEMIGQKNIVNILKGYVNNKNIPHLLFAGDPGIGKTTAAVIIAKELFGDNWENNTIMMNASDERGIDVVRNKIKQATKFAPMGAPFKIIFLDEFDEMCLVKGTKVIVGFNTGKKICNIENIPQDQYTSICSLNINTKEIERDKGICIDTGISNIYEITLADDRIIKCTLKHPFFIFDGKNIIEKRLCDLSEGDEIVDFSDELVNQCEVCEAYTVNQRFCSIECSNIGHSKNMTGEGNSMYNKDAWNKGKTKIDDSRIAKQGHSGDSNVSKRPEVNTKRSESLIKFYQTEEGKKIAKVRGEKISQFNSGKNNNHYIDGRYINLENWKKAVLNQGNHKCSFCESNNNLVCHHIMNRDDYPNYIYNVNNGQVLCNSCHTKLHNTYRRLLKMINIGEL